jgi:hypothetical protein
MKYMMAVDGQATVLTGPFRVSIFGFILALLLCTSWQRTWACTLDGGDGAPTVFAAYGIPQRGCRKWPWEQHPTGWPLHQMVV